MQVLIGLAELFAFWGFLFFLATDNAAFIMADLWIWANEKKKGMGQ